MVEQSYTIKKPKVVTDKLNLSEAPVGLIIGFEGNRNACTVEPVPPTAEGTLSVDNSLLEEFLETGAIVCKNPSSLNT